MEYLNLGERVLEGLSGSFTVKKLDIGRCASLSKKGMTFFTDTYDIENAGHLCIMKMKAMLGLMKMETVVLSITGKDLPLFNMDWVGAFGKETLIVEIYDDQLTPYPEDLLNKFSEIGAKDSDLTEYTTDTAHWYDSILYPCSYHKTGKKLSYRFSNTAEEYSNAFIEQLASAPACDISEKKAKVSSFAETLYAKGGPAVDQVKKLFGDEIAGELIIEHMYGC